MLCWFTNVKTKNAPVSRQILVYKAANFSLMRECYLKMWMIKLPEKEKLAVGGKSADDVAENWAKKTFTRICKKLYQIN